MSVAVVHKLISCLYKLWDNDVIFDDGTFFGKLYYHVLKSAYLKENIPSLLPSIGDWLHVVLDLWGKKEVYLGVEIFTLQFIGYIGSYTDGFNLLQDKDVLPFILYLISSSDIQKDCDLMIPLINSLKLFSNHEIGWKWTIETMVLKHVVNSYYETRSIYTKKAVTDFTSELLIKSTKYDENVGKEIMRFLCKPLLSNHLIVFGSHERNGEPCVDCGKYCNETFSRPTYDGNLIAPTPELMRAANYLMVVLHNLLFENDIVPSVRLDLIYRPSGESVLITDILGCSSLSQQDFQMFSSLLLILYLNNIFYKYTQFCNKNNRCLEKIYILIQKIMRLSKTYENFKNCMDLYVIFLSFLVKVMEKKRCEEDSSHQCSNAESAIVFCMAKCLRVHKEIFTDCVCNLKLYKYQTHTAMNNDGMGEALSKLLSKTCSSDSDRGRKLCLEYIHNIILVAVNGIERGLRYIMYEKNVINIYVDVHTTLSLTVNHFGKDQQLTKPIILGLLNLLRRIVDRFRLLTWRVEQLAISGSGETVVSTIIRLLRIKTDDKRVTILALQTLVTIIMYHIMPVLTSPVDDAPSRILDSYIQQQKLLAHMLDSESWEVRDTTLEVFQSVTDCTELMPWILTEAFPSTLLNTILKKAAEDESGNVRATAINFFTKTVRCKFYDDVIQPSKLLELAIKTLLEDNIPEVRKSACGLIEALYINCVPAQLNDDGKIFESVFKASVKDLDGEVRVATMNFWQCIISKYLMDKKVPYNLSVFHIENPLSPEETVSRIISVLDTLGEIGCLKAIWLGLNDECDIEFAQKALSIVDSLEKLNEQWNFLQELLKSHDVEEQNTVESDRQLRPKDFFTQLQKENWREKLDSRIHWIQHCFDDLESILDYILENENRIQDSDHNAIDCY